MAEYQALDFPCPDGVGLYHMGKIAFTFLCLGFILGTLAESFHPGSWQSMYGEFSKFREQGRQNAERKYQERKALDSVPSRQPEVITVTK